MHRACRRSRILRSTAPPRLGLGVAGRPLRSRHKKRGGTSELQLPRLKNKIFLGKKLGRSALAKLKTTRTALCPASCVQGFKTEWGRAWCGHARPTTTFAPAKFGAGKFCRIKEQKTDISRDRKPNIVHFFKEF